MLLFDFILTIFLSCFVYELKIKPYFQKRHLAKMEKELYEWAELVNGYGIVDDEAEKKEVADILKIYKNTEFSKDQLNLKIEVVRLIFMYISRIFHILVKRGVDLTTLGGNDNIDTTKEREILWLEKQQLKSILKNLLPYINTTREND